MSAGGGSSRPVRAAQLKAQAAFAEAAEIEAEAQTSLSKSKKLREKTADALSNLLLTVNPSDFYTIVIDGTIVRFEVTKEGKQQITDEFYHDFVREVTQNVLETLLIQSGLMEEFFEVNNEEKVLEGSLGLASCTMSINGLSERRWFPLSAIRQFGDATQDNYESFLPIYDKECFDELLKIGGLSEIKGDRLKLIVDALKRGSVNSAFSKLLRDGGLDSDKFDTTMGKFSYLDAANSSLPTLLTDVARDPEPAVAAAPSPSPSSPSLSFQSLSPSANAESEEVDGETFTSRSLETLEKCIFTIGSIELEVIPIFDGNNNYNYTNIKIKLDGEQIYEINIKQASVSNIILEIEKYIGIESFGGAKRGKKRGNLGDEIVKKIRENKKQSKKVASTIIGILLIKTIADPIQSLTTATKSLYSTFDGNCAIGIMRSSITINNEEKLIQRVMFEKGIGALILHPLNISHFSCFLSNIAFYLEEYSDLYDVLPQDQRDLPNRAIEFLIRLKHVGSMNNLNRLLRTIETCNQERYKINKLIGKFVNELVIQLNDVEINAEYIFNALSRSYPYVGFPQIDPPSIANQEAILGFQKKAAAAAAAAAPAAPPAPPAEAMRVSGPEQTSVKRMIKRDRSDDDDVSSTYSTNAVIGWRRILLSLNNVDIHLQKKQTKQPKGKDDYDELIKTKFHDLVERKRKNDTLLASLTPELIMSTCKTYVKSLKDLETDFNQIGKELEMFLKCLIIITSNLEDTQPYQLEYSSDDLSLIVDMFYKNFKNFEIPDEELAKLIERQQFFLGSASFKIHESSAGLGAGSGAGGAGGGAGSGAGTGLPVPHVSDAMRVDEFPSTLGGRGGSRYSIGRSIESKKTKTRKYYKKRLS